MGGVARIPLNIIIWPDVGSLQFTEDVYFFAFPIGFDLGKKTPLTVRCGSDGLDGDGW